MARILFIIVMLLLAVLFYRNGGDAQELIRQAEQILRPLISLGASIADHTAGGHR
jgi:hypothetical protein